MNTTKCSTKARNAVYPTRAATYQSKKALLLSLILTVVGIADAANMPSGLTGLWRFENSTNRGVATIGSDITFIAPHGATYLGPWTDIGIDSWHTKFSDGSIFQEVSFDYMAVNPNFTTNGGGAYVNEYTVAVDYLQTSTGLPESKSNSLFQTAFNGNGNDGDLWIAWTNANPNGYTNATIGVDDVGYSTNTFDASKWHRIVWSVDNGNFFRVYVDGVLFLDGPGQAIDDRFSLYPDRFNLFADNNWHDAWGLVGNVMTWNRALTGAEIAGLGGWIGTNDTPTPLLFPDDLPSFLYVSPRDGASNLLPGFSYEAGVLDLLGFVDANSIQLLLDGLPVTPVITSSLAQKVIKFSSGGFLQSGSTHTYKLIGSGGSFSFTNEVTFKVRKYTSYEWRFLSGDLSTDLGNGTMSYYTVPAGTTFGTTDGSTVPHINGSPAKYMHVPAFTINDQGYYLTFNDSGPNVGGGTNINRYTILMDVMVPSPWPVTWIVPFFNTDIYDQNDADFYLYGDGSIGIGGPDYSAPGVMVTNTWYRLAFVSDLNDNTLSYYVNGNKVKSGSANGLDGRWSIYSNEYPGADLLLFNEPTGLYTHELYVSSIAFADRALSTNELAALGGPSANGILVPSFTPRPTMKSQRSGSNVVISWPTNYVGYALQGKSSLAGAWSAVPGVTNNAVNIPQGSGNQFFRLVQ